MKKTLLSILSLVGFTLLGFTQTVPNGDFENWQNRNYHNIPTYDFPFVHTNTYAGGPIGGEATITKVGGVENDSLAIRLETNADTTNGILLLGQVDQNDSIYGGFAFNEIVDQLKLVTNFDIKLGDTANVFVIFTTNTLSYSVTEYQLTGSQQNYDTLTIDLDVSTQIAVPTKCIIALFSSNTEDSLVKPGSYIEIDDMWFMDNNLKKKRFNIPNGSFEEWDEVSFLEPTGWETSNLFSDSVNVTQTSGLNPAVQLISQPLAFGDTNGLLFSGLITGEGVAKPGFALKNVPTKISIDYQYTPASSTDTAVVYLGFSYYDFQKNERKSSGLGRVKLEENSTMETIDIPFYITGPVDSIAVTIASSIDEESKGHMPQVGSKLIVDNLTIETVTETYDLLKPSASLIYPNPATNRISISDNNVKEVIVLNNMGQAVLSSEVSNQSLELDLESGAYIIQLLNQNQELIKIEKVIIQ